MGTQFKKQPLIGTVLILLRKVKILRVFFLRGTTYDSNGVIETISHLVVVTGSRGGPPSLHLSQRHRCVELALLGFHALLNLAGPCHARYGLILHVYNTNQSGRMLPIKGMIFV
ncbi:hypothetical protein Trydic_g4970 [Trypoxylus dichotomus]